MKIIFLLIAALLIAVQAAAQEKIESDRPDQTETPYTVPKGWFQGEVGFNKENLSGKSYNIIYPVALLKYGITNRLEFRFETAYVTRYEHLVPNPKTVSGLEPIEIGAKIGLLEEKGWLPKTSLIAHFALPFAGSKELSPLLSAPAFRFTMQHNLTENIGLNYNLGAEWNGYDGKPAWLYTLAPSFNIGERWYAYIEAFGFYKDKQLEQNFDGGLGYFISNNAKLDLSAGIGANNSELDNYVAIGFSFRIPVSKKAPKP